MAAESLPSFLRLKYRPNVQLETYARDEAVEQALRDHFEAVRSRSIADSKLDDT